MNVPARLQDLPPAQARLCLKVRAVLSDTLAGAPSVPNPRTLNVAFSGGTDSTALLLLLHYLAPSLELRLRAAHLDHALRPESGSEAEHCAAFCASLGIPFQSRRVDVAAFAAERGLGIEEAARACRYAWLAESRSISGAAYTVLGHQLDDLAEDILMRLIRGVGWPGLGGMPAKDDARRILRPLLYIPRADLRLLLSACGLSPLDDPSNADCRYTRNRVRHEILPLFLAENPGFLENAAALHRMAELDADLFHGLLPAPDTFLPYAALADLPKALRLRLYKSCLDVLGPGQVLSASLANLDDSHTRRKVGAIIQFSGGKIAETTATGIAFRRSDSPGKNIPG